MYKSFIVAAAAALVAGRLATGLAFGAPEVKAGIPSASAAKDDPGPDSILGRIYHGKPVATFPEDAPGLANAAAACSEHAWPHYEPRCLFDATRSVGDVHKVRVIIMDGRKRQ